MGLVQLSAILCAATSRKLVVCIRRSPFSGYGLLVYIGLGYKLSMLSIHSPDYVFTVLVSIFIRKTAIVRVIEYSASITHACALQMVRTTYNQPTPPAPCLGTPVSRQKLH